MPSCGSISITPIRTWQLLIEGRPQPFPDGRSTRGLNRLKRYIARGHIRGGMLENLQLIRDRIERLAERP